MTKNSFRAIPQKEVGKWIWVFWLFDNLAWKVWINFRREFRRCYRKKASSSRSGHTRKLWVQRIVDLQKRITWLPPSNTIHQRSSKKLTEELNEIFNNLFEKTGKVDFENRSLTQLKTTYVWLTLTFFRHSVSTRTTFGSFPLLDPLSSNAEAKNGCKLIR